VRGTGSFALVCVVCFCVDFIFRKLIAKRLLELWLLGFFSAALL
jgi:hypothetical protein